jgi:hypothetical protein
MEEQPLLEIENEEAAILADWISIGHDLSYVISATKKLYDLLEKDDKDSVVIRSLWTSALVTYIRCFTSGKRKNKLSPEIFKDLKGDPIGTHQYYKDTRDKHIAHPVNIFEEIKIGVMPSKSFPDKPAIMGVGHLYTYRLSDDKEGVRQLGLLASIAMTHVNNNVERAQSKVKEKIETLTIEELKKLNKLIIQPKGGGEAAKRARP